MGKTFSQCLSSFWHVKLGHSHTNNCLQRSQAALDSLEESQICTLFSFVPPVTTQIANLGRLQNYGSSASKILDAASVLSPVTLENFSRSFFFKTARPHVSQLQSRLEAYSLLVPSTSAPKPLVKTTVYLSAAAQPCQLLFGMSWRMRTKLTNLTRIRR